MKKYIIGIIALILYFTLCFGSIILSYVLNVPWLFILGMVTIGVGGVIIFVAALILIIKLIKAKHDSLDEDIYTESDDHNAQIDINTSSGVENQINHGKYVYNMAKKNQKYATDKEKTFGIIFIVILITSLICGAVLLFAGIGIGCYICFGVFVGTLFIALLCKIIAEQRGMSTKKIKKDAPRKNATVIETIVSSYTAVGGFSPRRLHPARITSTVYKVILNVDGNQLTAYSQNFYNAGDKVKVALDKNGTRATIVDEP